MAKLSRIIFSLEHITTLFLSFSLNYNLFNLRIKKNSANRHSCFPCRLTQLTNFFNFKSISSFSSFVLKISIGIGLKFLKISNF